MRRHCGNCDAGGCHSGTGGVGVPLCGDGTDDDDAVVVVCSGCVDATAVPVLLMPLFSCCMGDVDDVAALIGGVGASAVTGMLMPWRYRAAEVVVMLTPLRRL